MQEIKQCVRITHKDGIPDKSDMVGYTCSSTCNCQEWAERSSTDDPKEEQDIFIGPARQLEGQCFQPANVKSPTIICKPMPNEGVSHITLGSRLDMTGQIMTLSMKAQDDPKEKKNESIASWIPSIHSSMSKGVTDGTTESLGDSSQAFESLYGSSSTSLDASLEDTASTSIHGHDARVKGPVSSSALPGEEVHDDDDDEETTRRISSQQDCNKPTSTTTTRTGTTSATTASSNPVTCKIHKKKNERIGLFLCKYKKKDGIYISKLMEESKASASVLRPGMKMLKLNRRRCPKDVQECIKIIAKTRGWLTVLAQEIV
jgi:hypothetical protein